MLRSNDDPRALRSRAAALAAATELLVEGGPENVTHAGVAKRAGIGRATVYRHWPDQQALLLDALAGDVGPLLSFGDGPVRDQLVSQAEQMAHRLNQPSAVSILVTVIERAERDEDARRIREEMFGRADEELTRALATAVERGELRPGVQDHARELVARIFGPLLFERFLHGVHLEQDLVVGLVDAALAPWLPNA
ncbi:MULTISPECIES: TetR/AcrR family transcriptional regulator [unclassified Streptomyces]|jgi:AcrR family transcriptional regulator|uniref:TetR/AcrR family transcriptional regulator n=1 Tax=unclassified Streptomyces TaxID=2593676 RepID=UPI001BAE61F5|nr:MULTISPECIES: TetR/AcrR family transcriptional regulator [unclassified Streptomyces]MDH6502683.1 AcrR family transcriptional regulator [Streptomyces sp. SAI-149]QUC59101.1 TetR/AcrR family transcriptional regulator [Streptomyces sp. A2-16]GLP66275.1 TetR family transcriptional regulator [Streptomyces sp. TUS-ST3]